MKNRVILLFLLVVLITSCTKTTDFKSWSGKKMKYPKWATPLKYELEEDNLQGPKGLRRKYTIEEGKKEFRQLRYLVENHSKSEKTPYYYRWKINLISGALILNEPHIAYKHTEELLSMPKNTVLYSRTRRGKTTDYTVDYLYSLLKSYSFKAIVDAGFTEEAKEYYKTFDYKLMDRGLSDLSRNLHKIGLIDESEEVITYMVDPINLDSPWRAVSSTLAAASFYYGIGEYYKAIDIANIVLETENKDEKYFKGKDTSDEYFTRHWNSSVQLINKYKDISEKAIDGEVVDLANLKDGSYIARNTGYILTPIDLELTIDDGSIASVEAYQNIEPKDDRSGTSTETVPEKIVKNQDFNVDVISTATISSESVKLSVIEALLDASKN